MAVDLDAARDFLTTNARLLDRRRFALDEGRVGPGAVLDALSAYSNPDGGYGWGLEPDVRSATSQPAGALHGFEVLAEVGPETDGERAVALADWVASIALDGGALPFGLSVPDPVGCARFWAEADPTEPSLHVTSMVAAMALRCGHHVPAVAGHPWVRAATGWCLDRLRGGIEPDGAHETQYVLQLLDLLVDDEPDARSLLDRLASAIPADGMLPVAGGAEGEALRPLTVSPEPGRPLRAAYDDAVIAAELDRVEGGQQPDGGWTVDFGAFSPASELAWRGLATLEAVRTLRAHGRLG